MKVTVSIPDKFVNVSEPGSNLSRQILEAYALENYRQEKMSLGQIAELLDLSIDETHALLKARNIPSNYGTEDLARDRKTIELFLKK